MARAGNFESYSEDLLPECFERDATTKLNALDCFRLGGVRAGLDTLGVSHAHIQSLGVSAKFYVPGYDRDKEGFHNALEDLAAKLEEAGL